MKSEILELEKVLNEEIEAYSKLERFIIDKKNSLVRGDIEKLKYIDFELEKYSIEVDKLGKQRTSIKAQISCENLSLKDIIERIENEDQNQADRLTKTGDKLKNLVNNIKRQNKINTQLIEHSLKLIEHSVISITNALVPESSAYNNFGRVNTSSVREGVSSIIEDA